MKEKQQETTSGGTKKVYDVFVIYRRECLETAKSLVLALEKRGLRVFFDIEVVDGNCREQIYDAINQSKNAIFLMTEDALDKCAREGDWVRNELEHVLKNGINLIPICPSDTPVSFPDTLPPSLQDIETILVAKLDLGSMFNDSVKKIITRLVGVQRDEVDVERCCGVRYCSARKNVLMRPLGATAAIVSPLGIVSELGILCANIFGCFNKKRHAHIPGMSATIEQSSAIQLDQVEFSAITPKVMNAGILSKIQIVMYEKGFRNVVEEIIQTADDPVGEIRSGKIAVSHNAKIKIVLSSPDFKIDDDVEEGDWSGEYRVFGFVVQLPADFLKPQVLFVATVYIQGVVATKLKFIVSCNGNGNTKPHVQRKDINSAFISYASEDRPCVINIVQGMQKVRPDLDVFLDVAKLRSGEDWERRLYKEIGDRDVLYLCWSRHAMKSEWVDREWRYAFNTKGIEGIEPVPIEPAESCPPPKELSKLHFNDYLQYLARGMTSAHGC